MRYSDIKTTMDFYSNLLYQDIAANLHKRFTAQGAPVGDTLPAGAVPAAETVPEKVLAAGSVPDTDLR